MPQSIRSSKKGKTAWRMRLWTRQYQRPIRHSRRLPPRFIRQNGATTGWICALAMLLYGRPIKCNVSILYFTLPVQYSIAHDEREKSLSLSIYLYVANSPFKSFVVCLAVKSKRERILCVTHDHNIVKTVYISRKLI